jgi:thioredoxin reductase (NADPH)
MEITAKELEQKVNNGEKVIVEFHAAWCGPCRMMKPMFEQAAEKLIESNSDVKLYTFNIESDKEFAAEIGLRSVPTIKAFSNGKEVFTEVGLKNAQLIMEMAQKV